jgi:signal transduction histidine kinase
VLEGAGPWSYLRVEDSGTGIAGDRLAAIFEPYTQAAATAAAQRGGTGLGLAISRRLARLMGGDLTVQSQEGAGSAFYV